jgi:hypothetical protein
MHKSFIVFATEKLIRRAHIRSSLSFIVNNLEFHYAPALTAGRTITLPFWAPGTAPLTSNN